MFSNTKLIVSDMDGTLLNDKGEVNPEFFTHFKQLSKRNILFCAASGRQYDSIISKLSTIKDEIYIIAENGSNVRYCEKELLQIGLSNEHAKDAITKLRAIDDTYIVLCTNKGAYIETTNEVFVNLFKEYYNHYHIVSDLMEVIPEVVIYKIASYHFKSSEAYIYPEVKSLGKHSLLKISSQHWLDISSYESNKGNALQLLQKRLGILPSETVVIGDYLNDLELYEHSELSFAVQNAHPEIKKIAKFETTSNNNLGVENVLKKVLESLP